MSEVKDKDIPKIVDKYVVFGRVTPSQKQLLVKALKEKGYRVPEDISVVGYDDYLYPGLCDIGITTYSVDMEKMSQVGMEMLLERMGGSENP